MHPELLKATVQACRDYIEAGDCHGAPPPIERLIDAVVQLADALPAAGVMDRPSADKLLGNLLARIHRDGGHYVMEHGWQKAAEDAEAKVLTGRVALALACFEDEGKVAFYVSEAAAILADEAGVAIPRAPKPVAWFKHGPYEGDEPLVCVFDDPHDDICYSPVYFAAGVASSDKAGPICRHGIHMDNACGACEPPRGTTVRPSGVRGTFNEQQKELGACSISRATIGDRTHDRGNEESHRGAGEEEQRSRDAGRRDATRAGGAELSARGGDAAQHAVSEDGGTGDGAASGAHGTPTPSYGDEFSGCGADPLPAGVKEDQHAEVVVTMPRDLTPDMLRAVRQNPLTSCEDKDEENRRIGWLLCAWDVLIEHRTSGVEGTVQGRPHEGNWHVCPRHDFDTVEDPKVGCPKCNEERAARDDAQPFARWKVVHVPGGEPFMERAADGPWVLWATVAPALAEAHDVIAAGKTPCCPPGEPHSFDCPAGVAIPLEGQQA